MDYKHHFKSFWEASGTKKGGDFRTVKQPFQLRLLVFGGDQNVKLRFVNEGFYFKPKGLE